MQPPKYRSTGHWVNSPTVHRDDTYHPAPEHFIGARVVVTEKLDGGNTCLFRGDAYARSVDSPAAEAWFAMVKKYHAWKTGQEHAGNPARQLEMRNYAFYGEDIYGVHSIEYGAVHPSRTFYLFSVVDVRTMESVHWGDVEAFSCALDVPTVPVVHKGVFNSVDELSAFLDAEMEKPSALGGEREGFVIRLEEAFPFGDNIKEGKTDVMRNICKYVRPNHVQTDQHWRRNWKSCKLSH